MLIDIDTNDKYFIELYSSYAGGCAENLTYANVIGVSKLENIIFGWYSKYAAGEEIFDGYKSPEGFIKNLLKTAKSEVWVGNCGGIYDDASSFGLVVTELNLYKESELARLKSKIAEVEALA